MQLTSDYVDLIIQTITTMFSSDKASEREFSRNTLIELLIDIEITNTDQAQIASLKDIENHLKKNYEKTKYHHEDEVADIYSKALNIIVGYYSHKKVNLHFAAAFGSPNHLRALVEKKGDVNIKCGFHQTPLHSASYYGQLESVRYLIENKADVNAKDLGHHTPLHSANSHPLITSLLLANKANPNVHERALKNTPLHDAAAWNYFETIKILMDYRADIYATNFSKELPVDRARILKSTEALAVLKRNLSEDNSTKISNEVCLFTLFVSLEGLLHQDLILIVHGYIQGLLPFSDDMTETFQPHPITINQTLSFLVSNINPIPTKENGELFYKRVEATIDLLQASNLKEESREHLKQEIEVATLIRTDSLDLSDWRKKWKKEKLKITQKILNNHQLNSLLNLINRSQPQRVN